MAESLIDIKKRIESTKLTKQITNAMQMVSAAKLAKAEQYVSGYQEYSDKIRDMVAHVMEAIRRDRDEEDADYHVSHLIDYHHLLTERPVKRTGYLVISSDQGLAGSYNSSLFQSTLEMLRRDHQSADEYVILAIGTSAINFFKKEGIVVAQKLDALRDFPTFDEVRDMIVTAMNMYCDHQFDAFYVCYKHHVHAMMSVYRAEKLLPLTDVDFGISKELKAHQQEYVYEPSKQAVLEQLLPQYAESLIYGAIIEAKASEHASRMVAMRSATHNADELIDSLIKKYHQKRQTSITQEITEIVGGSVALTNEE